MNCCLQFLTAMEANVLSVEPEFDSNALTTDEGKLNVMKSIPEFCCIIIFLCIRSGYGLGSHFASRH